MSTLAVLLKESWSQVEDDADELANYFYARLFLAEPGLRELFPVDLTDYRSRLLAALAAIISTIDDPETFDRYLRDLSRDSRRMHVQPHHYGMAGNALLDSLRAFAADRWCIEYDQAWRDAYDAMATKLLRGAAEDADEPAFWHAEVVHHERRSRDIAVITCRPLVHYPFRAGQYVNIETRHHPREWRSYSIANAPRADGTLDLHVRAPADAWVSAALVRRVQRGDMLRLGPPMGSMTLDSYSTRDIVCIAGGTGLAPIKALVEELTRTNRTRWVHVFFGARDRDDLYDVRDLSYLAGRYPWLSLITACSADPTYPGERGTINDVVERYGPWPDHDVYVCGSPPMVRATLATLARMGIPQHWVRYDAVGPYPS